MVWSHPDVGRKRYFAEETGYRPGGKASALACQATGGRSSTCGIAGEGPTNLRATRSRWNGLRVWATAIISEIIAVCFWHCRGDLRSLKASMFLDICWKLGGLRAASRPRHWPAFSIPPLGDSAVFPHLLATLSVS